MNLQTTNISEEQVIIIFHSYLQASLAQAHAEKLLDESVLTSAEADIQIQGPAICLFLAALRSHEVPPSITTTKIKLNQFNCPSSFTHWFELWASLVPSIHELNQDQKQDLARIICDQEPKSQPIPINLPIIARTLLTISLEISQRRTFQERFNEDLNFALNYGSNTSNQNSRANFKPPPAYHECEPRVQLVTKPLNIKPKPHRVIPNPNSTHISPATTRNGSVTTPDVLPTLAIIRETVYASLTDVLYSTPSIYNTLCSKSSTDGQLSRAYFAALSLAILDVSLSRTNLETQSVNVVQLSANQPTQINSDNCPIALKPLMKEFIYISTLSQTLASEDDTIAMRAALSDEHAFFNMSSKTKIERLRFELENGPSLDEQEIEIVNGSNVINKLALKISQIESFREREHELFSILIPSLAEREKKKILINT
ncbi:hypothetical protein CROQUDRAFT_671351 [Cronartium quercuum f. sp. fusiforme G11]|uniref:Uncharacterized protein n=1 Tax=Cronartium quercuum f. sp. fusiforme G11 TaxID=708437 RepID=A0A9P6NL54_9BASI|nr:hypothetical protein CROQUDRAFT_671351 [Cronartium quercuum f. sp. fusiforme G11]